MKKSNFLMRIVCFVLALTLVCAPAFEADAAAKAVKVTGKTTYTKSNKQYTVLKGKSSTGKVVWTYKSRSEAATELNSFTYKVKGNYIYCTDTNRYIRIKKSTGKVVAKKTIPDSIWSGVMYVDSNKNMYVIGYYGDTLYKLNSKGSVVWKKKVPSQYYWPSKIKQSGSKIVVTFDGEPNPGEKVSFKMSNGKIV